MQSNVFMRQHAFDQLFKIGPDLRMQYCADGEEATFAGSVRTSRQAVYLR